MSSEPTPRQRELDRLARHDHETNCPDDIPFDAISLNHRHVHEVNALRTYNRRPRGEREPVR